MMEKDSSNTGNNGDGDVELGYPEDVSLSDTEAAIRVILNKLPNSRSYPRLVLKHQLYEIISNKTEVEEGLNVLRSQNRIQLFEQVPSPQQSCYFTGIMLTEHFVEDIINFAEDHSPRDYKNSEEADCKQVVGLKRPRDTSSSSCSVFSRFAEWTKSHSNAYVFEADLLSDLDSGVEGVDSLRGAGFLQQRVGTQTLSASSKSSGVLFTLCHPKMGVFSTALSSAQKYIVQRIKMTKYKEIQEKKLISEIYSERKSSRQSRCDVSRKWPLGLRYHIYDMVGRAVLSRIKAPSLSVSATALYDGVLRLESHKS